MCVVQGVWLPIFTRSPYTSTRAFIFDVSRGRAEDDSIDDILLVKLKNDSHFPPSDLNFLSSRAIRVFIATFLGVL